MHNQEASPRKSLPLGWLALDAVGTGLLAIGVFAKFAPVAAADVGLSPALAWPLIISGGIAMLLGMTMFFVRSKASRKG